MESDYVPRLEDALNACDTCVDSEEGPSTKHISSSSQEKHIAWIVSVLKQQEKQMDALRELYEGEKSQRRVLELRVDELERSLGIVMGRRVKVESKEPDKQGLVLYSMSEMLMLEEDASEDGPVFDAVRSLSEDAVLGSLFRFTRRGGRKTMRSAGGLAMDSARASGRGFSSSYSYGGRSEGSGRGGRSMFGDQLGKLQQERERNPARSPPERNHKGGGRRRKDSSRGFGGDSRDFRGGGMEREDPNAPPPAPLAKSTTRWKPIRASEITPQEQKCRQIKGLLNKLTQEKFDPLSAQIIEIMSEDKTIQSAVVDLIFEKATEETGFCKMYSNLCRVLNDATNPSDDGPKEGTFKFVLLNKCQLKYVEFVNSSDAAYMPGAQNVQESGDEKDAKAREKMKLLGNIVFIGELFREKLLIENIAVMLMNQFIQQASLGTKEGATKEQVARANKMFEGCCVLLSTAAEKLDRQDSNYREKIVFLYKEFNKLVASDAFLTRIRVLARNLMDLRRARWRHIRRRR